jgi:hypothetical protein
MSAVMLLEVCGTIDLLISTFLSIHAERQSLTTGGILLKECAILVHEHV